MSHSQHRPTILIVDDVPMNILILAETLNDSYRIKMANNGEDAIRIAHQDPIPDLILLDVMMPKLSGYEVCERLQADSITRDIPIIFVTAQDGSENEAHGLLLGAVDYITKPISPLIVLARVSNHLALKQARETLTLANVQLQHEKEIVENIIDWIRSTAPFDNRYLRCFLSSVDRTAGDMLFSAFRPDGCQHILVSDFSGHGLPAALGGPLVSYIFYQQTAGNKPLNEILTEINRTLQHHLPTQIYMAACAVEISADRAHVKFWNHGLPEALIFHQGIVTHRISSAGLPLGILEPMAIPAEGVGIDLMPDGYIYIYSDGITEVPSSEGEQFGSDRLEIFLASMSQTRQALEQIHEALVNHFGNLNLPDDATLIEIRCANL